MATKLSGQAQVNSAPLFGSGGSTVQEHDLGARIESSDGRVFRYVRATPNAVAAGYLLQGTPEQTNHQARTVGTAAAVGATVVEFAVGATAAGANKYAGGYLVITGTPGTGYTYKIKGHGPINSSGAAIINLEDPIEVALTTSSTVDLVANPFAECGLSPVTATGPIVGVSNDALTAGRYGWVQSGGAVGVRAQGALVVGASLIASDAGVGSAQMFKTGSEAVIGYAVTGVATGETGAVHLTID